MWGTCSHVLSCAAVLVEVSLVRRTNIRQRQKCGQEGAKEMPLWKPSQGWCCLVLTSGSQSVVPRRATALAGSWLNMSISKSHPKPTDSERPRACILISPPGGLDLCPKLRTTGLGIQEGLPETTTLMKSGEIIRI